MPPFYYCESVKIGKWLITGIDSCVDGEAGGRISDAELGRLQQVLDTEDAEHIMICLHHPPLPVGSAWLDQVGLDNSDAFFEVIASNPNVRAAVFGHVHQPFDQTHRNVRIIGTPSTCAQFKPGSHEFALDQRPPGYRQIALHENGTIETELVWLADQA